MFSSFSEFFQITFRKIQNFSVIQILQEINFGESRWSKTYIVAILGAMNFWFLVNLSLQNMQKYVKIRPNKCVKIAVLGRLKSPTSVDFT